MNELYKLLTGQDPCRLAEQVKSKNTTRNSRSNDETKLELLIVELKMSENDFIFHAVKYREVLIGSERSSENIEKFKSAIKTELPSMFHCHSICPAFRSRCC